MKRWYVADFETTDEKTYEEEGCTRVWLWSICDEQANVLQDGYDIDSFFKYIKSKLKHGTIYFHNLKFDGSFIIDYLLTHDIPYAPTCNHVYPSFETLIDDMGAWYKIVVHFSKATTFHIIDSLKVLPFKAEKIAKDFDLPILKGKIDYSNYEVNQEKLDYIHNDVRIIAMALSQIKEEGIIKLTTASSAYNYYEAMHSEYFMPTMYPNLPVDFLIEWRKAYRGGRSQVNKVHQGRILKNIRRYDINSMYPYIMAYMDLPYGNPQPIKKMGEYKFELYHIKVQFFLKDNHIPSLLKKGSMFTEDTYYVQTEDIEEMWISSIDFELVQRHYDIVYLEFIEGYGFFTTNRLFDTYVSYWYNKKQETTGAKRIVCKLMLNSLYGKFGSKVMLKTKIPYYEDKLEFNDSEEEEGKHYYIPVAIAITSYAHKMIDDAICETGVDNFVYCDTDSVHTLGTLPEEWVDNKKLGKFKLEAIEKKGKYVRQKTYITYELNGDKYEYHITCAGMPELSKETVIKTYGKDVMYYFDKGLTVGGKLLPKRVKGGTILHETYFTIK